MESKREIEDFCHQILGCISLEEARRVAFACLDRKLLPKPVGTALTIEREPSPVRNLSPASSYYSKADRDGPAGTITGDSEYGDSDGYTIDVHFGDTPPPTRRRRVG